MLDTIVLTLDQSEFEVTRPDCFTPSAAGLLMPPYYSLTPSGSFVCIQNPTKMDLEAGRYPPRLTLAKRKIVGGFALTLRIEFSAPKLIFGNNFDEVETGDFDKTLDVLNEALGCMGIRSSCNILCNAKVAAIHYSKNIAFTDYTTCSMVIHELQLIDLTRRLDLSRTDYRNEGQAIRYHANSYEVTFYDKLKDLQKAAYSVKRGIERDYGAQIRIFRDASLPKELEVLRMEVRLGTRAKIKSVLRAVGETIDPTFKVMFDAKIAKAVLMHFWAHVRSQLPLMDTRAVRPEYVLSDLAAALKGKAKPGKLLQQLGCIMLINSVGVRAAGAVIGRHSSSRSWQRYKHEWERMPFRSETRISALNKVDDCLGLFLPLRMETFSRG